MISNTKEHSIISAFVFFACILDDFGGSLGIRNVAVLIMTICLLFEFYRGVILFNNGFVLFYLGTTGYLLITVIIAMSRGVSFLAANQFNFNLYFLIISFALARSKYLTFSGYLLAVKMFALLILFLFFGRVFRMPLAISLYDMLSSVSFGEMKNGMVAAYLRGTLELVGAAAIFSKKQNIIWFLICLIALAVAPSRFGVTVSLAFFILSNINKLYIPMFVFVILSLIIFLFNIQVPVLIDLIAIFDTSSSGNSVKYNHLLSIIELFKQHPTCLIFGQGPETSFYTTGFHKYVTLVEIHHFDLLRKYGLIYFTAVNAGLFYLLYKLYNTKQLIAKQIMYGIMAHYIVAISNPVLVSLPYMMLISIAITLVVPMQNRRHSNICSV